MNKIISPENISPESFRKGAIDMLPMLLGTAPFGLVFGAFAYEMELGILGGQGLSSIVFAGSAQFVGANLYGQGASLLVVFITTFCINIRHALYGAALAPKLIKVKRREQLLMSFFITDEAFAIVSRFNIIQSKYFWGAALVMYFNWQSWTFIGLLSGSYLKEYLSVNSGFLLVPAFIAIIFPQIKTKSSLLCVLVAAVLSLVLSSLPYKVGFITSAILAIIVTIFFEYLFSPNPSKTNGVK
jgi:4-azaleucine resistance transporter AzlC